MERGMVRLGPYDDIVVQTRDTVIAATIEGTSKTPSRYTLWRPTEDTAAVISNGMDILEIDTTDGDINGVGHGNAQFAYLKMRGGGDVILGNAHESRIENFATTGGQLNAYCVAAGNQGADGNSGNVLEFNGLKFPDLSGATYNRLLNRRVIRNDDPQAIIQSAGRAVLSRIQDGSGNLQYQQTVIPRVRPDSKTGRYIPIQGVTALYPNTAISRSVCWAMPIVIPNRMTITSMGFILGTGIASCVGRIGAWADKPSGAQPDVMLLDAGTITCGVGDVGTREITGLSLTVDPGVLWGSLQFTGGAGDPSITYAGVNGFDLIDMAAPTTQESGCYFANATTLPANFGTPTYFGGGFSPYMWVRGTLL